MMRESDDEDEEDEHDSRPPAYHEQQFNTKIEQEIGYIIEDQFLREQIAQDIYDPKPKPEFGFDPTVPGADPTSGGKPMVQFASYAANQGEFKSEQEEQPTNLVASSRGYVMSKNFGDTAQKDIDKEVSNKFGGGAPIDDDIEGSHRPYQALDTVDEDEDSEEEVEVKKSKKAKKKEQKMKQEVQGMGAAKDRIRGKSYSDVVVLNQSGSGFTLSYSQAIVSLIVRSLLHFDSGCKVSPLVRGRDGFQKEKGSGTLYLMDRSGRREL
jgi:hypothetical protein